MPTGRVKWFNAEKGFGFIAPDDGSEDLFVHYSGIRGSGFRALDEGAQVQFEVGPGAKRPQARDVVRLDAGEPGEGSAPSVPARAESPAVPRSLPRWRAGSIGHAPRVLADAPPAIPFDGGYGRNDDRRKTSRRRERTDRHERKHWADDE